MHCNMSLPPYPASPSMIRGLGEVPRPRLWAEPLGLIDEIPLTAYFWSAEAATIVGEGFYLLTPPRGGCLNPAGAGLGRLHQSL